MQTSRQHDEEVYRRAVEEVDKIMAGGKLTEKDLQNLQRNFANHYQIQEQQHQHLALETQRAAQALQRPMAEAIT
jgi:hypothetical protein